MEIPSARSVNPKKRGTGKLHNTVTTVTPLLPLALHIPGWLYAHTYTLAFTAGLIVFRSPALRHTDEMYKPVRDILENNPVRLVVKETILDEEMMFGEGELAVYRCNSTEDDAPLQPVMEKFMKGLIAIGGYKK